MLENMALDRAWLLVETSAGFQIKRDTAPVPIDLAPESSSDCFLTDDEAVGYVLLKAMAGDARCKDAMRKCYGFEGRSH